MKKSLFFFAILSIIANSQLNAQVLINEVSFSNTNQIADEDDDYPDWFELFNASPVAVNLYKYQLSDGLSGKNKWIIPDITLAPGDRKLIFASGKNRPASPNFGGSAIIDHWETAIVDANTWEYEIGSGSIGSDWVDLSFNSSNWLSGQGGIGYGDGDDQIIVPDGTISVYTRTSFNVPDKSLLTAAILSMDYDDGFVAYLNGVEIAREGLTGTPPDWNEFSTEHEAELYNGGAPSQYKLDINFIQSLLVTGTNVLAVEVHNLEVASSDLTMRPFLHFGIKNSSTVYGPNPSWFDPSGSSSGELHTNFKLKKGETLVLRDSFGTIVDSATLLSLQIGHVQARIPDGVYWCITDLGTPDQSNDASTCYQGYAKKPVIELPSGFYTGTQTSFITGNTVKYTLDGALPDISSPDYVNPIAVSNSSVLRARGYENGKLPSEVSNASYFINELTELPVVSITAVPGDLFDDGSGGPAVYDNYWNEEKAPCHVSYFNRAKDLKFEENASVKVVGNFSVSFVQKSLQFDFDDDYGALEEVPNEIFNEEKPGITKLHGFRIRNMDDDAAVARMRDPIANRICLPTHADATASQNVAVFINGIYWGHYAARELLNEYFVRDNYNADPDSVDIIKTYFNQGTVAVNGTIDNFDAMRDFLNNNDLSDNNLFNQAKEIIDVDNWADYWAANIFVANGDWFSSVFVNNTQCFKSYSPEGKWKFVLWDVGYSQGIGYYECSAEYNSLYEAIEDPVKPNLYTPLFSSLLKNQSFKIYFINRFADLLNYYWKTERVHDIIDKNVNSMSTEIQSNYNRWDPVCTNYCPLNYNDWLDEVQQLKDFYTERPAYQREHINSLFNLDGEVEVTLEVQPKGAGFIKISTIIPDSLPWTGIYFNGNPVSVTAYPNPGYTFSNWSTNDFITDVNAPSFTNNISENTAFTANFNGSPQDLSLTISEINYNSDPTTNSGNWFELHNFGNVPRDISGYTIATLNNVLTYTLASNTVIPANAYIVVVDDIDKFHSQFPLISAIGPTGIKLDNGSDTIMLKDLTTEVVLSAGYSDKSPWPQCADGHGRTLENVYSNDLSHLNEAKGWFDGCMGGSPGKAYSPCNEGIPFNEINYHSPDTDDAGDWIELLNTTSQKVDLSGWKFRDSKGDTFFSFPSGTQIEPDSFLVVYSNPDLFNAIHPGVTNLTGPFPFGLSNDGEIIRLFDANDRLYLSMYYNDKSPWVIEPDGEGPSLELILAGTDLNKAASWEPSCDFGTPGRPNTDCSTFTKELNPNSILVSPNPSDGIFKLKSGDATIVKLNVRDIHGRIVVAEHTLNDITDYEIDLSSVPPGVYFLQIISSHGSLIKKLTVL